MSPDRLPEEIATEFRRRIPEFANLGFELVGCFDCGVLVNGARSYVANFCNPTTNEFAKVSAMSTPNGPASYFEFSARFSIAVKRNTRRSEFPGRSGSTELLLVSTLRPFAERAQPGRVFLHELPMNRQQRAGFLEPRDAEIQRYARMIENFGPRQARVGYMKRHESDGS